MYFRTAASQSGTQNRTTPPTFTKGRILRRIQSLTVRRPIPKCPEISLLLHHSLLIVASFICNFRSAHSFVGRSGHHAIASGMPTNWSGLPTYSKHLAVSILESEKLLTLSKWIDGRQPFLW